MILVALGSNVGERAASLRRARDAFIVHGIAVVKASREIETPALLMPGAPLEWDMPFLNQVVQVETALAPLALLQALKTIERTLGRVDRGRWGPREIDLDLLSYGDEIIESEILNLPHPALHRRDFVLRPLVEIAPHWRHPGLGKTATELLEAL